MLNHVNSQKYIRTGDKVISKKDNKKRVVHYVVNNEDQISFDEPLSKIKKLIVYCGSSIEHLFPTELKQK